MSITDELREYVNQTPVPKSRVLMDVRERYNAIADRIGAKHEKAIKCLEDEISHSIKLPKDADGEPIHIGDVMGDRSFPDAKYTVVGIGEDAFFTRDASGELYEHTASLYIHHHAPTVEDVLREFALCVAGRECMTARPDVIAEYAAKLRLADGEEQ